MVRLVGQRVAAVEEVPQDFVDRRAYVAAEAHALLGDAAALLVDLLALLALQPGQQFVEIGDRIRFVLRPVELHAFAQQPAGAFEGRAVGIVDEQHMG